MTTIIGILKGVGKILSKLALFCGMGWLLLPLGFWLIYELVTKDLFSLSNGFQNPVANIVFNTLFFASFVLAALKFIQNLVHMVKKDSSFSWVGLIMMRKDKQGFEAKLDGKTIALKTASDLSGVVFGKQGGKYVTMPEDKDGHILAIGGPGSGKTTAHAITTLMSWKERIFAIDIKGELYEKTKNARDKSKIKVFNPTDRSSYGYDPYHMLKNADDISSAAKQLALSICPLSAEVKDPFWIKSGQSMLTGFIIYFFNEGLSFSESMRQIKSQPVQELIETILLDEGANPKAKMELTQFAGINDKTLSGIFSELSNHISVFATNDDLQWALSGKGNCITPADLESGYDIYCCIPEHKLDEWKDLLGMMCNQFLKSFERRGEDKKTPILFLIDEFPRLGKIEVISNGLATLRGKKIHIDLIVQSKSQLNAIYGKDIAEVISDNCSYKVILRASEPDTQEWCSKLVGTYDKKKVSSSYNADVMGVGKGQGTSSSTEEKRIIKPEEFAYLQDVVCIFPNGYKRLKKANYYEDKYFLEKTV